MSTDEHLIIASDPADGAAARRETVEFELLRCLARAALDHGERTRLGSVLSHDIVWPEFIALARRHHLLPLCEYHLRRLVPQAVPGIVLAELSSHAQLNARRMLQLAAELRALLRLLADAGIPAVTYKGPVLAQQLYGSMVLRDVLDLDLLVAKTDVARARELLAARGYRADRPGDRYWDAYVLRSGCNFRLVQESTGLIVELHWTPEDCMAGRALDVLWERRESVAFAGTEVHTFARADLLLLLCLHGCRHMWERLEWVAGVAELLRLGGFSWDEVLRLARLAHSTRALHVGLVLAHGQLGAPVPDPLLQRARADAQTQLLVAASYDQLLSDSPALAHQLGLRFHRFQLRSRDGWTDRLRYLGGRMLAPSKEDAATVRFPWHLFRLYAATRPLRLLASRAVGSFPRSPSRSAASRRVQ